MQIPPDPMNQQIPPAPMSPAPVPEMPVPTQGQELSQEEMRKNLEGMMSKVQEKYGDFQASRFDGARQETENHASLLREMFDFFESVGVDPSDPAEIQSYIEKLRDTNPELAEQLETLLLRLVDDNAGNPVPEGAGSDNMNIDPNEVPQQNL